MTADDGVSASTTAAKATIGGYAYAAYSLVGIATGTWAVRITSGSATVSIASVAVPTQGMDTAIPNSATSPAWTIAGDTSAILTSGTDEGIVSGRVTTPTGSALANVSVTVEPGGSGLTDAQGFYSITFGSTVILARLHAAAR